MPVQKNFGIVADIRGYVQVTKDIKYDVLESVQSAKNIVWQMVPYISKSTSYSFTINGSVSKSLNIVYGFRSGQGVLQSLDVPFEIKRLAYKNFDIVFDVNKEQIKKHINVNFGIAKPAVQYFTVPFEIKPQYKDAVSPTTHSIPTNRIYIV